MNQVEWVVQPPLNKATVRMDGRKPFWDLAVARNPKDVAAVYVVALDQRM